MATHTDNPEFFHFDIYTLGAVRPLGHARVAWDADQCVVNARILTLLREVQAIVYCQRRLFARATLRPNLSQPILASVRGPGER